MKLPPHWRGYILGFISGVGYSVAWYALMKLYDIFHL